MIKTPTLRYYNSYELTVFGGICTQIGTRYEFSHPFQFSMFFPE